MVLSHCYILNASRASLASLLLELLLPEASGANALREEIGLLEGRIVCLAIVTDGVPIYVFFKAILQVIAPIETTAAPSFRGQIISMPLTRK